MDTYLFNFCIIMAQEYDHYQHTLFRSNQSLILPIEAVSIFMTINIQEVILLVMRGFHCNACKVPLGMMNSQSKITLLLRNATIV
jgi:hypothetical protein